MSPIFLSIVNLLMSVLFGGVTWQEAVQKWLADQIANLGSREAVVDLLTSLARDYEHDISRANATDGMCCSSELVGRFGDGKFLEFLKTVDWAKVIAIIIQFMPKAEPAPANDGPVVA
jgi:hypothetical protein